MGLDLSAGMLRHAKDRLPTTRADAEHLLIRAGSLGPVARSRRTRCQGAPAVREPALA